MMLTVHTMRGTAEADLRKGSSQSRYQGYTTGAQRIAAAIGHANASDGRASDLRLSQIAVRMPTRTASPATSGGAATRSSAANTGSLKRKLWTYVPSEPIGMCPCWRNGV